MIPDSYEIYKLEKYSKELEKLREEWSEAEFKARGLRDKVRQKKEELYWVIIEIIQNHWQYHCPKCHHGVMGATNSCLGVSEGIACMECSSCHYKGPLFPSVYDAAWHWLAAVNDKHEKEMYNKLNASPIASSNHNDDPDVDNDEPYELNE